MVSVILPAYNAEKYIAGSIKSVISQSFNDWELLIVDDGSTDATPAVCDSLALADSRLRVFHRSNAGVSAARNFGLDAARGDYIAFLDADDILHPDFLTCLLAPLEREGDAGSGPLPMMSAVPFLPFSRSVPSVSGATCARCISVGLAGALSGLLYQTPICGTHILDTSVWGKLYRRSLWHGIRFREKIRFEDLDIFYHVLMRARHIAFIPVPLIYYRLHHESFIHTFSPARLDVLDVTDRLLDSVAPLGPEIARAARTRRFAAHFNILLLLMSGNVTDPVAEKRCLDVIMHEKTQVLRNSSARLKDRLGALLACLGRPAIRLAARLF